MRKRQVTLTVNGRRHDVWVTPSELLLDVLHDELGMPEVRYGCGEGVCGTCTVRLDGHPVSACLLFAVQAEGHQITTVAALLRENEALHPLQECLLRHGGAQCGFCTPGMLLTAEALTRRSRRPSRAEIRYELVGNLCRCTGYTKILDAVQEYLDTAEANPATPQGASPA
jgi:aerobic-type carbon monoxide dehydrogenase small subunit (CoxS/CutS family)